VEWLAAYADQVRSSGCPSLNLIERLWGHLKRTVLANVLFATLDDLVQAFFITCLPSPRVSGRLLCVHFRAPPSRVVRYTHAWWLLAMRASGQEAASPPIAARPRAPRVMTATPLTHIPRPGDEAGLRRLGVNLTSEPHFSTRDLCQA